MRPIVSVAEEQIGAPGREWESHWRRSRCVTSRDERVLAKMKLGQRQARTRRTWVQVTGTVVRFRNGLTEVLCPRTMHLAEPKRPEAGYTKREREGRGIERLVERLFKFVPI